jgi:hypothetical protein
MWRPNASVSTRYNHGERALYCDTVVFVQNTYETPFMKCGDTLGDMASEIKANDYISEFVSAAPRNMPINYVIL